MLPTTASVLDQSLWWLVPYAVLILLMVYAMMEFTVTLLQRPPANRKPVAGDELRRRLLALHKPDHPHPLVVGQDCDLEMRWQHGDSRRSRFALSRHSVIFWASGIWSLSSARWIGTPCWCSSASPPAGGASGVF